MQNQTGEYKLSDSDLLNICNPEFMYAKDSGKIILSQFFQL